MNEEHDGVQSEWHVPVVSESHMDCTYRLCHGWDKKKMKCSTHTHTHTHTHTWDLIMYTLMFFSMCAFGCFHLQKHYESLNPTD